jgi:hypothetical protein
MPYLPNHKWEVFARESVELELAGDKQATAKAYERAGYLPNPHNARRLRNRPLIKERRQELFREAIDYRGITATKLAIRLDRVGSSNIADYFESDGRTLRNITTLPRELSAAIESIEFIADGEDESGKPCFVPKLKLRDANAANTTLLKHMGGLPEPEVTRPTQTNNILNVLSIDDQQVFLGLIEALSGREGAAGGADQGESGQG